MHESGDLHAFWRSFHVQDFFFVSLHEILRGLRPLLDVMYLHWIRMCFVCGDIFPKCCPQIFSVVMDSFRSLFEPDSRSFPVSVELYMWHHIGIAISLSLQRTEIALYGLPDPHFRLTPFTVFALRIFPGSLGRCSLMMMLSCRYLGSLCLGTLVVTIRACIRAWFFSSQPIEHTPSFRGRSLGEGGRFCLSLLKILATGDGLRECLCSCLLLGSVRAVGVLDSENGTLHGFLDFSQIHCRKVGVPLPL
ncbi:hypothetical protein Tco_1176717 [Tanacetum coccineum]